VSGGETGSPPWPRAISGRGRRGKRHQRKRRRRRQSNDRRWWGRMFA
jgi:hypothetical protein